MADKRLIDANALRKGLREAAMENDVSLRDVLTTIDLFPTIDAVPVVRCNMCRYYETDTGYCAYHDGGMHWDGFCSCGAKMDKED